MLNMRLMANCRKLNFTAILLILPTYIGALILLFHVWRRVLAKIACFVIVSILATIFAWNISAVKHREVISVIWSLTCLFLIRYLFYPVTFAQSTSPVPFESIVFTYKESPRLPVIASWMDNANISYTIFDEPFETNSTLVNNGLPADCIARTSINDIAMIIKLNKIFSQHLDDKNNEWIVIFEDDAMTDIAHIYSTYMSNMFHQWSDVDVIWLDIRSVTDIPFLGGGTVATAYRVKSIPTLKYMFSPEFYCKCELNGFNIQSDTVLMSACRSGLVSCKRSPVFFESGVRSIQNSARKDGASTRLVDWFEG